MKNMMQHDVAWDYEENRRKIHEILDIVLDTNTLEARTSGETGTLPTTYFSFSGISGSVEAELYPNGWSGGTNSEVFGFYTDEEISQERIDTLRRACKAALEGKTGIEGAQQRVKRLEREIRERQKEMELLGLYIEREQSGIAAESGQEAEDDD